MLWQAALPDKNVGKDAEYQKRIPVLKNFSFLIRVLPEECSQRQPSFKVVCGSPSRRKAAVDNRLFPHLI